MHDLDRTLDHQELEADFETGYDPESEGNFGENEELALAEELLGVTSEAELDLFLGKMFKRIGRGVSRIAKPLGRVLRPLAKAALPIAGKVVGGFFGGPIGATLGSKLGTFAGRLFELELEGLDQGEAEVQAARRFVRFAGDAAQRSAALANRLDPGRAVRQGVVAAARRHAPGFLKREPTKGHGPTGSATGVWKRVGRTFVLSGV
jgi:hypothetical protein